MKSKILKLFCIIVFIIFLTGCESDDNVSSMTTYTSVYPSEYILERLYGDKITIYSIYPDGINYKNYSLTDKQISDFSKGDLYVYNGIIKKEKNYAAKLVNKNKKIKIIDASQGMDFLNDESEAWLNPANYLMMASNIKKGLEEYITEKIDLSDIDKNYEDLKLDLSKIEAELKLIATTSNNPTLVVSNDAFKFLEKYGFTIISLQANNNLTEKTISEAKKLLKDKSISYIFLLDNEKENNIIKNLKENYEFETVSLNSLSTLNANDRNDKKDYISIMMDNINSIKLETNN